MSDLVTAAPTVWLVAVALGAFLLALRWPLAGLLAYLWLDFMRPQDAVPALAEARPMFALAVGLSLSALVKKVRGVGVGAASEWRDFVALAVLCLAVVPASLSSAEVATAAALEPLKLVIVAWLIAHHLGTRRDFDRAVAVIAGSLAVLAVCAVAQGMSDRGVYAAIEGPGGSGGGLFSDNNDLARALLFGLACWGAFVGPPPTRRRQIAALVAIAVVAEGIVFTGSRGGFVGLVIVGSYLLFAHLRPLPAALTSIVLVIALVRVAAPAPVAQRIETIARPLSAATVQSRFGIWRDGLRRAAARPLLGHGVGTFAVPHAKGPGHTPRTAHNIFVELFYETGALGLFAYLFVLVFTFVRLRRFRAGMEAGDWARPRAVALEAALIGFTVASLGLSAAFQSMPFVAVGLAAALRRVAAGGSGSHPPP